MVSFFILRVCWGAANLHRCTPGKKGESMKKGREKQRPGKAKAQAQKDIFKKYAAPKSKNFLYFEQLQQEFYLLEGDK